MNAPSRMVPADRIASLQVTLIRQVMALAGPNAINLGLGQVDEDVPDMLRSALVGAASVQRAPYSLNLGLLSLREKIGAHYDVDPEQVLITTGVQEAIALTIQGLVNPGDEVIYPAPGFPIYEMLTQIAGGVPRPALLRAEERFRQTWADIEPLISDRTRLVVIASPGNPTGAISTPDEFARMGRELEARGIPWVSDEIYIDFQPGPHRHPSMLSLAGGGFVASGLSKSHAVAGWRIGWLIGPPAIMKYLLPLHQQWVVSVPTPMQEAAIAAFSPAGRAWVAALAERLGERRIATIQRLEAMGLEVAAGDGAFYLWVRVPEGEDDMTFAKRCIQDHDVIVMPGRAFTDAGCGYVRLSYSAAPERLTLGLDRLQAALAAGRVS
jgi:aspartate aminotransferase